MKRKLEFEQGIICGDTVRSVIKIFPILKDSFKQRKTYDEYYFEGDVEVEITLKEIHLLVVEEEFTVVIPPFDYIKILE